MTADDYRSYLSGIELGARQAARNAKMLPARPEFETNAEAELDHAFRTLAAALDEIITARKALKGKPVAA